jgi:DNA processing protein
MRQISLEENTAYVFALGLLKGIGSQAHRRLVSYFPTFHDLHQASLKDLEKLLRSSLANVIYQQVQQSPETWSHLLQEAEETLSKHIQKDIVPIPITSPRYPPLLKKIPDPPVILYAKGNVPLLQQTNAVAIVGTREPTEKGENVARHLAVYFAKLHYSVISGLAKGIDKAAHEGALQVQGKTIAVFGTPLDQIYPAANKDLAQRILETDGLLLSEIPLGHRGFRSAFVMRDRIQSGLSLAVIPVQTKSDGGTMHTVNFARNQERLIACPIPLKSEGHATQYEGIYALLRQQNMAIYPFKAGQVEQYDILEQLQLIRQQVLSVGEQHEENEIASKDEKVPEQSQVASQTPEETTLSTSAKQSSSRSHVRQRKKPQSSSVGNKASTDNVPSSFSYKPPEEYSLHRVTEQGVSYEGPSSCVQISFW